MLRNQGVRAVFRAFWGGILLLGANAALAQTVSVSPAASEVVPGDEITFSGSFPASLNLPANGTEYRLLRCNNEVDGATAYEDLQTIRGRFGESMGSNCQFISTAGMNGFGTGKSRTLPSGSDAPKYTLVVADFTKHLYFAASTASIFAVAPVYSPPALLTTLTLSGSKTAGEAMTVTIAHRTGNVLRTNNSDFTLHYCPNSPLPPNPADADHLGCSDIINTVVPASGSWSDNTLTVTIPSIAIGGYLAIEFNDKRSTQQFSSEWGPIQRSASTTLVLSGAKLTGAPVTATVDGVFTNGITTINRYGLTYYRCPSAIDVSMGLPKNGDGSVDTVKCPVLRANVGFNISAGATTASHTQPTAGRGITAGDTLFAIFGGRSLRAPHFTESAGYGPYAAGPEWGSGLTDSVTYPSSSRSVTLTWQRVDAASSSGRFPSHFRIYRHETADQVIHLASGFADKVWDDTPAMANCGTSSRNCSVTLTSQPWHSSGTMHYAIHSFTESGATTYTGTVSDALAVAVNAAPTATPTQNVLDTAPPLALMVGDSATSYSQTFAFSDMDVDVNDGDSLSLPTTASSSNSGVATATYNSGTVTVTPGTQQGSTLISVTATDGAGAAVSRSFMVTVNALPVLGQAPAGLELVEGSEMAVTLMFTDPGQNNDGDATMDDLTFTAESGNPQRATVSPTSGDVTADGMVVITVTAGTPGDATDITVKVTDGIIAEPVSQTFAVTVTAAPVTMPSPPSSNPGGSGDRNPQTPNPPAAAAASSGGGGGAIAAIVIGAGVYYWWKKRQIASGNAAKMALLPEVSFDLDRSDRRAFYTKMNWQNPGHSNWQLRGNASVHTKYSGKLLDWHADSHIGYRLNGKFGDFNPYAKAKFVQNDPENAKMDETYTLGVNYAIPNRFSAQFLQPDDEIWRYSLKTEMHLPKGISLRFNQPNSDIWRYSANLNWQISERIGLNLSQSDSDLDEYGFGIQWRNKSKIRYGISGETGRNSYRFTGSYSF